MDVEQRDRAAAGLAVAGGAVILAALLLPWSHQVTPAARAAFRNSPLLAGVPSDPTAWQAYSFAAAAFVALAAGIAAAGIWGGRGARSAALVACLAGAVLAAHAIAVPPSDGVEALLGLAAASTHATVVPSAGPGETVALAGLAIGTVGLAGGLAAGVRRPASPDVSSDV